MATEFERRYPNALPIIRALESTVERYGAVVEAAKYACEHGYGGVPLVRALRKMDPEWYAQWRQTWPEELRV